MVARLFATISRPALTNIAKGRVHRVVFVSGSAMRSDVARAVRKVFKGVRAPLTLSGSLSATLRFQ